MLNQTPPDVPSGVIIAVQLLPALQALKLVTITVVPVRESTHRVTASLTCVLRCNVIHVDTVFLGFVYDVTLQFLERPLLEFTGVQDVLADVL